MYSPITAKRLLDKEGKRMSDLAEYIFNDRRHSVKHLFVEGANPTAQTLLGMAEFFHVPMDILFDRQIAGSVAGGADNDLLKKLVISQEDTIQLLKNENAMLKEQVSVLKNNKR